MTTGGYETIKSQHFLFCKGCKGCKFVNVCRKGGGCQNKTTASKVRWVIQILVIL